MDYWVELAKGPLFALTFLIMLLGLARHVLVQVFYLILRKGRQLRHVPWNRVVKESLTWAVPVRHLIPGTVLFSVSSFLFHVGAIAVPLFLPDHIVLWEGLLSIELPTISRTAADMLTISTIVCVTALFLCRLTSIRLRVMSRTSDYVLLIMVLLPFLTGFLASHPSLNPLPWRVMMLIHILSAEALFVAIPFTKLSHIVLYLFDRISVLHWQLRPGAGDRVARAIHGDQARI
jgi:nitrate reductase gamma subunit